MDRLVPLASEIAALLIERRQSLAVTESSVGGLISASLVSVPGASAFFLGSTVIYTRAASKVLHDVPAETLDGLQPLTEAYIAAIGRHFRNRMRADWVIAEMGASGPSGSPYGPPAGTASIAVVGPVERTQIVRTGHDDRRDNMRAFGHAALTLLRDCLTV